MKLRIIGFGFSGLACAYAAIKKGWQVEILESRPTPGGMINTVKSDGEMAETAANGFMYSQNVAQLFSDLKIEMLTPSSVRRSRYIFSGSPKQWPLSVSTTLKIALKALPLWFKVKNVDSLSDKIKILKVKQNQTLEEWALEVLGTKLGRPFVDYVLSPAVGGIYAVEANELDAELILRSVLSRGPRTRGPRGTVAPKGGMSELFSRFVPYLAGKNVTVLFNHSIDQNVVFSEDVPTVIATSVGSASKILSKFVPEASLNLARVKTQSLISATLIFKTSQSDLRGFGCLFPSNEKFFSKGVLFNSDIFESRSKERAETYIIAGKNKLTFTDDQILNEVLGDRKKLNPKSSSSPTHISIHRWEEALPIYNRILRETLMGLMMPKGVYLNGNYLGHLSLTKILDNAFVLIDQIEQDMGVS